MTDRELLLAWQADQQAEIRRIDQTQHYEALACGLVTFCQTFLLAIQDPAQNPAAVTRSEALQLLAAAIQGR